MSNKILLTLAATALALATGSLNASAGQEFTGPLNGYQTSPPIYTNGTGSTTATLSDDGQSLSYTLNYSGVTSAVSQAHIHFGQTGVNGGVIVFLCDNTGAAPSGTPACPTTSGTVSGTVTAVDVNPPGNPLPVNSQGIQPGEFSALVGSLQSGDAYVNVHTADYPAGEIRGQLLQTPAATATSTQAKSIAAPGATVNAGSVTVTNSTQVAETINSLAVSVGTPSIFSSLTLSGAGQTVTVTSPSASTTFTLSPGVALAAGASSTFSLSATVSSVAAIDNRSVRLAGAIPVRLTGAALPVMLMLVAVGLLSISIPTGSRRRVGLIVALALAIVTGIAGCSGSSNSPTITASSAQAVTTVAITVSALPVGISGLPASLGNVLVL